MPKSKFWLASLSIFLILFYPLLITYFSMDDFFHFTVFPVQEDWGSFVKIFGIYKFAQRGIAFYRPLSRELIFFMFYKLFGLVPLPYRLLQIAIHFANTFLVYRLILKLTKKELVARLTSFFFLTSAANTAILYYLAGGVQSSLMTTFLLLTCIFFIKFIKTKNKLDLYKTYLFNLLALMSFETAVAIPILLFGIELLQSKKRNPFEALAKRGRILLLPILLSILFFAINYFYIGFSSSEAQYSLNFSIVKAVNTVVWYTLWAFGLPEMLIDFVGPGLHLNPNLMAFWGKYFLIIFPVFFLVILHSTFYLLRATRELKFSDCKIIIFFIIWFVALLGPFLLLPAHKSTHYLAPALPAFWAAKAYVFDVSTKKSKYKKIYLIIFITLVLTLNATSIKLGEKTYWAVQRGNLAKKVLMQLKSEHPNLPSKTTLYIKNDPNYPRLKGDWGASSTQVSYILSGDDAVHLLYNDFSINVLYEDLSSEPVDGNAIEFTARLK